MFSADCGVYDKILFGGLHKYVELAKYRHVGFLWAWPAGLKTTALWTQRGEEKLEATDKSLSFDITT